MKFKQQYTEISLKIYSDLAYQTIKDIFKRINDIHNKNRYAIAKDVLIYRRPSKEIVFCDFYHNWNKDRVAERFADEINEYFINDFSGGLGISQGTWDTAYDLVKEKNVLEIIKKKEANKPISEDEQSTLDLVVMRFIHDIMYCDIDYKNLNYKSNSKNIGISRRDFRKWPKEFKDIIIGKSDNDPVKSEYIQALQDQYYQRYEEIVSNLKAFDNQKAKKIEETIKNLTIMLNDQRAKMVNEYMAELDKIAEPIKEYQMLTDLNRNFK